MRELPSARSTITRRLCLALLALVPLVHGAHGAEDQPITIRVGHFPNITHVQALVARALARHGKGWFAARLGNKVKLEWYIYNAGPSAMEAILAGAIDLTYVGPNPALNAYVRSRGREVRVIAGAVQGGSALVVQGDSTLRTAADFRGKRIATPQFGNTQDVAARAWLTAGGLHITQTGGDAQVIPTANPDQLALFKQRQLDAVWTVEPWVSRLVTEAGGKVLVNETSAVTTVLASSRKFLTEHRELAARFAAAHRALTAWIVAHPAEAQRLVREELRAETRTDMPADLVAHAWERMTVTADVSVAQFQSWIKQAQQAGFLRGAPDLTQFVAKP